MRQFIRSIRVGTIRSLMLLLFASRTLSPSTPSSHPVYASVGLLGTPEYLPYFFFERPFLPILSRDHREEIHKEIANGRTSLRRAKGCVSGNALSQWSGGRAKKVRLYARSRVGRRLAIQSCCPLSARVTKGYNLGQLQPVDICLRCEGMSWSHGQVVRTRFVRLGSNPLSNLSSIAHEFELCLPCLSLLEFVYPYPLRNTSISHDDIHQPPRCRI